MLCWKDEEEEDKWRKVYLLSKTVITLHDEKNIDIGEKKSESDPEMKMTKIDTKGQGNPDH